MAQLINEAKRFQKLAGILKESPNMAFNQTALDYSNTNPNTPPGATAGKKPESQLNEFKYKNNTFGNVNGHGRIDFSRMLTDDEVEKFAEKLGHSADKIYLDRDGREHYADGQYYEYTTIIDPTAPNAGGKTSEEMKKIASELNLKESLDIDAVVNEALAKVRKKQLNENKFKGHGFIVLQSWLSKEKEEEFKKEVPEIYVYRSSGDDQMSGYNTDETTIYDETAPNAGGKTGAELKAIAKKLGLKVFSAGESK